jgi:hypothetical protein
VAQNGRVCEARAIVVHEPGIDTTGLALEEHLRDEGPRVGNHFKLVVFVVVVVIVAAAAAAIAGA